ncbi:MAG: histidine phosphatase family protein [Thermomicrobiales bacterium]
MIAQRETVGGAATLVYLPGNHFGSVSLVTSSNGAMVSQQESLPWGSNRSGVVSETAHNYTGQEYHPRPTGPTYPGAHRASFHHEDRRGYYLGGLLCILLYAGRTRVTGAVRAKGTRGRMTHLYLIRHGEATTNVEPIIGGMRGDTGLSPLGVRQAEALRDRLAASREIVADLLIASTLPRARQTAEILAPALGRPILWEDDVQEMRVGEADGLRLDEFARRFGVPDVGRQPYRPLAPGGESWAQFLLRVGTTLHRIADEHDGQTIVIVCHGGVIDGSMLCFFGMNTQSAPAADFHTHNTSITHWERRARPGMAARWRLVAYNDIAHLRDIGAVEHTHWDDLRAKPLTGADQPAVPLPTEPPEDTRR